MVAIIICSRYPQDNAEHLPVTYCCNVEHWPAAVAWLVWLEIESGNDADCHTTMDTSLWWTTSSTGYDCAILIRRSVGLELRIQPRLGGRSVRQGPRTFAVGIWNFYDPPRLAGAHVSTFITRCGKSQEPAVALPRLHHTLCLPNFPPS